MQGDFLGDGNILVEIVAASEDRLIIHRQLCEAQALRLLHLAIDTEQPHHASLRA